MPDNENAMTLSEKQAWYFNLAQRLLAENDYEGIAILFGMGAEERAKIDFERMRELSGR